MANSDTGRAAGTLPGANPTNRLIDEHEAVEPLVNEHEAAKALGLSVKTLRRWRWTGKPPPFVKIGAAVRYEPPILRDFIAAGRRKSTSDTGEAAVA